MGRLAWSALILYLTAAGGYGGWRGRDLWSDWGIWCFLLPPVAVAAFTAVWWWRSGGPVQVAVVMSVFAVIGIAAPALGIAWGIAEATERWSANPAVRAIAGAALGAAGGGMALAYKKPRNAGEPRETEQHDM